MTDNHGIVYGGQYHDLETGESYDLPTKIIPPKRPFGIHVINQDLCFKVVVDTGMERPVLKYFNTYMEAKEFVKDEREHRSYQGHHIAIQYKTTREEHGYNSLSLETYDWIEGLKTYRQVFEDDDYEKLVDEMKNSPLNKTLTEMFPDAIRGDGCVFEKKMYFFSGEYWYGQA